MLHHPHFCEHTSVASNNANDALHSTPAEHNNNHNKEDLHGAPTSRAKLYYNTIKKQVHTHTTYSSDRDGCEKDSIEIVVEH